MCPDRVIAETPPVFVVIAVVILVIVIVLVRRVFVLSREGAKLSFIFVVCARFSFLMLTNCQALEVIKKLKEVMPIDRAKMKLRVNADEGTTRSGDRARLSSAFVRVCFAFASRLPRVLVLTVPIFSLPVRCSPPPVIPGGYKR